MQATILCYHKVGSASQEGRSLNIEPSRLRSHVQYFFRKKYRFVIASELSGPWNQGMVCFTFDDAYQSTMVHAPEIFEEVGARGTFYAVPGRVGKASDWDGPKERPLADWDLLRSAQTRGHEIGNHTENHVFLAKLSIDEQRSEIKSAHEHFLAESVTPNSFCYPYGSHDDRTVTLLQSSGYQVGVQLGKRLAQETDNRLSLPRVVVAYSDALPMLLYKLRLKPWIKKLRS